MKLSRAQRAMLRGMVLDRRGMTLTPGGYSTAGRDASRWWRTVAILHAAGLVVNPTGYTFATITRAGRVAATDRWV